MCTSWYVVSINQDTCTVYIYACQSFLQLHVQTRTAKFCTVLAPKKKKRKKKGETKYMYENNSFTCMSMGANAKDASLHIDAEYRYSTISRFLLSAF